MGVHWIIQFLVGAHEKTIYRGELPKVRGREGLLKWGGEGLISLSGFAKNLWKKNFIKNWTPPYMVFKYFEHSCRVSFVGYFLRPKVTIYGIRF